MGFWVVVLTQRVRQAEGEEKKGLGEEPKKSPEKMGERETDTGRESILLKGDKISSHKYPLWVPLKSKIHASAFWGFFRSQATHADHALVINACMYAQSFSVFIFNALITKDIARDMLSRPKSVFFTLALKKVHTFVVKPAICSVSRDMAGKVKLCIVGCLLLLVKQGRKSSF